MGALGAAGSFVSTFKMHSCGEAMRCLVLVPGRGSVSDCVRALSETVRTVSVRNCRGVTQVFMSFHTRVKKWKGCKHKPCILGEPKKTTT